MQFLLRTAFVPYCYLLVTLSLCDVLLPHTVNAKDAAEGDTADAAPATAAAAAAAAAGNDIDQFKNKDILMKNMVPDLSALNYASIRDSTSGYFEKLLAAWDNLKFAPSMILKDTPFTVVVPNVDIATIDREKLREFIQEHLIIGEAFSTFNEDDVYGNCNHRAVRFTHMGDKFNESIWTLNDHNITRTAVLNKQCSVIYIDGVLGDKKTLFSKRNIHDNNRYNEPQRLEWKNATKDEAGQDKQTPKMNALSMFLMNMRTGTKVFQHFLSKSNLSHLIDDKPYTVLIPSDSAFQRWHPIDWGFYPFSVFEFTESVLRNHFLQLKTPLSMQDIRRSGVVSKIKTLGDETLLFKSKPSPTVNNVSITADYSLSDGSQVFLISEVLFVSEAIVSKLHQMHKDKETPPLLAFPWFGAQFLSHSFLALEKDSRFTFITKFLNNAEIAAFVPGANYTFFVPMDVAFAKHGLSDLTEEDLTTEKANQFLLNYFIKGRLYDRDLKHDEVFESIGGSGLKIQRLPSGNVTVNHVPIVESQIFVYNLGTMYYIDDLLYPEMLESLKQYDDEPSTISSSTVQGFEVERMPSDVNESHESDDRRDMHMIPEIKVPDSGRLNHNDDDDGDGDGEIVTPRALPVLYMMTQPQK